MTLKSQFRRLATALSFSLLLSAAAHASAPQQERSRDRDSLCRARGLQSRAWSNPHRWGRSFVKPRQELAPYIESLWVFESETGLPSAERTISAPNGCSKLTFAYGDSFISTANGRATVRPERRVHFVGNRDSSIRLQSAVRKTGCIGIEFRPHGAFPIFGLPMGATFNFLGDADAILGEWVRTVQEGLNNLQGVKQRLAF